MFSFIIFICLVMTIICLACIVREIMTGHQINAPRLAFSFLLSMVFLGSAIGIKLGIPSTDAEKQNEKLNMAIGTIHNSFSCGELYEYQQRKECQIEENNVINKLINYYYFSNKGEDKFNQNIGQKTITINISKK